MKDMWVDFSGIRTGMVEVEEMDWPQDPTTTIVLFLTDEAKILIQHLRHPVCVCEGVGVGVCTLTSFHFFVVT